MLVLGPWSSFVRYAPALGNRIQRVLASGRPLAENNPDNFGAHLEPAVNEETLRRRLVQAINAKPVR